MYATCLFCTRPLGRNETVEPFPVGRRLAFDARRGRLWVVCPACRGWNLTPLEERWEAIEACERLFRGTRTRVSTDHIGLARVGDGVELVRVGEPLRPEFAAWRYGDRFAARRRRALVRTGVAVAGAGLAIAGGVVASAGLGVIGMYVAMSLGETVASRWRDRPLATLRDDAGRPIRVTREHLRASSIGPHDGALGLRLQHAEGETTLVGEAARLTLARVLPAVHATAGSAEDVQRAVDRLENAGDPERFFSALAYRGPRLTRVVSKDQLHVWHGNDITEPPPDSGLFGLAPSLALAIEMAAHEDTERRALEGELAQLEQAWRDAEEIGRIADDLLISERVVRAVDRLRGR